MMQLGFHSAIMPEASLDEVLATAARLGYQCVEIMCWPPGKAERRYAGVTHIDVTSIDAAEIKRIGELTDRHGVSISAVSYYPNMLSGDTASDKAAAEHFTKVIQVAADLGIGRANSFVGRNQHKTVNDNWQPMLDCWGPLVDLAEKVDVKIGIENCPMWFSDDEWPGGKNLAISPAIWRRMFADLPSKAWGLNYDPSHMIYQQMDEVAPIHEFADRIYHAHAKDLRVDKAKLNDVGILANPGEYHTPKLPGLGEVNWRAFFAALTDINYEGPICVEVEDRPYEATAATREQSLIQSHTYLRQFVPAPAGGHRLSDRYVGIDLGGTAVKLAVAEADGQPSIQATIPTDGHRGPEGVLNGIADAVQQQVLELGDGPAIAGVGMAVPGLVDLKTGTTKFLPNLQGQWRDVPAAAILRERLGCPVRLLNDVRTATLGELQFGHGCGREDLTMAFFSIGTGIGGGVVIDGRLRLGPLGAAGEMGHQTILPGGPPCGCGNDGCLEALASGPALAAEGMRLMQIGLAPTLQQLVAEAGGVVTTHAMHRAADQDAAVAAAIARAARYLGIAVANVVTTLHPELIVLGGGVSGLGRRLTDVVRQVVDERVRMFPPDDIDILTSKLGDQAGVLGAIALAQSS